MNSGKTLKTTSLFALSVTLFALLSYVDKPASWSASTPAFALYASILFLSVLALLVVAARATMVTWITVLVLLAVSGKRRRRSLVLEGRKITVDVAMYLIKVLVEDRGVIAVACAIIASLVALVGFIREADSVFW